MSVGPVYDYLDRTNSTHQVKILLTKEMFLFVTLYLISTVRHGLDFLICDNYRETLCDTLIANTFSSRQNYLVRADRSPGLNKLSSTERI